MTSAAAGQGDWQSLKTFLKATLLLVQAGLLFLVLLCTQKGAAETVASPGTQPDADEQFQQALALL